MALPLRPEDLRSFQRGNALPIGGFPTITGASPFSQAPQAWNRPVRSAPIPLAPPRNPINNPVNPTAPTNPTTSPNPINQPMGGGFQGRNGPTAPGGFAPPGGTPPITPLMPPLRRFGPDVKDPNEKGLPQQMPGWPVTPQPARQTLPQPGAAQLPAQKTFTPPITPVPDSSTKPTVAAPGQPGGAALPVESRKTAADLGAAPKDTVAAPTTADLNAATGGGSKILPTVPPEHQTAFSNSLSEFEKMAANWRAGIDDPIFRNAANRAILDMGLMNQAESDALHMQINQDPTLRGQGAGFAMLQMMARNQNFKMDDILGQLSGESMKRILDMQKYGFEAGVKLDELHRGRASEDIKLLMESGNFAGAAAAINDRMGKDYPGLNIQVDAKTIEGRDSQSLEEFQSQMGVIEKMAKTNPAGAQALLQGLMADGRFSKWFPAGSNAADLIKSMADDNVIKNLKDANELGTAINSLIQSGKTYEDTLKSIQSFFTLAGIDPTKKGQGLTLEEINKIRDQQGLSEFKLGPDGKTIVDDQGNPLDSKDYEELGYQKEFYDRKAKADQAPWQQFTDMMMQSEWGKRILANPDLYPNGKSSVESYVQGLFLGGYTIDPNSGMPIPKNSGQPPWEDPKMYWQFYSWPLAHFDSDGKVTLDANGKPVFDMGGDPYGMEINGQKVMSSPEDAMMDTKYQSYLHAGGKLTALAWYFATAGGTMDADEGRIPKGVEHGTVGGPPPGPTDPVVAEQLKTTFNNLTATEKAEKMTDRDYVKSLIDANIVKNYTNPADAAGTQDEWNQRHKDNGGYIAINGAGMHIDGDATQTNFGGSKWFWTVPMTGPDGTTYNLVIASGTGDPPVGTLSKGPKWTGTGSGQTPTGGWASNVGAINNAKVDWSAVK